MPSERTTRSGSECGCVLCLGCARVAVARLLLLLAGSWLGAGCWCRCQCCCRLLISGAAALSSCIMHDHVNGGLPAPSTWRPPQTRQGHSPRYDRMRNLNGFTQRQRKKEGAGRNCCLGALGAGMEKAWAWAGIL